MSVATATSTVLANLDAAARRGGALPLAQRLSHIRGWLADDLRDLERDLSDAGAGDDLAHRAANHLLALPGKRVRPLAVYLASRTGRATADPDVVRNIAVAAELVHTATLLHDDVLDEGTERRGASTSRMIYGNSASVLGGDQLLVAALQRVRGTGQSAALDELLQTISHMVAAEALQLRLRGTFVADRNLYMQVIDGKTAALFRWAMRAGARAGAQPDEVVDGLGDVGRALGIAFQLVDDTLDLAGEPCVTGKNTLSDLREGKLTWPLIVACERDPQLELRLSECARGRGDVDVLTLRDAVLATGCLDETTRRAQGFADTARMALGALPHSTARRALESVIDACVSRIR